MTEPTSEARVTQEQGRQEQGKQARASVSRNGVWAWTLVSLATVAGIAALSVPIAERLLPRLDLTAGSQAGLSQRTSKALKALKGPTRIIIAGELRTADPRARRALTDVLDEMQASSPLLSVLTVDTASATGLEEYASVLASLREREASSIDKAKSLVTTAASSAATLAQDVAAARASLATLAERAAKESTVSPVLRGILEQAPSILATRQQDILALPTSIQPPLDQSIAGVNVPAIEQARAIISAPLTASKQDARTIVSELTKLNADSATSQDTRSVATTLSAALTRVADGADVQLAAIEQLPRLDIARVADALARGAAGIIVGPSTESKPGSAGNLIALDIRTLLPDALQLEAAQASKTDLQRRVEDVLSTSLASLHAAKKPLLIITHADPAGAILSSRLLEAAIERLSLRGIDALEWAAATEEESKSAEVDPSGDRPRVYLVLSPDAIAQANATGLTGSQRVQKLAAALVQATRERGGILLSLAPSILPSYGSADPLSQLAEEFGLAPLSGTPLLTEVIMPSARSVETDRLVQAVEGDEPLQLALRSLPTYITWAIPIEAAAKQPAGARITPLLSVPATTSGPQTWAESQWQRLRAVRREDRASIPQAQLPTPDAQRERLAPPVLKKDVSGWVVAAAGEIAGEQGKPSRRIVVVGSNDWAIDPVTQQGRLVDGRPVLQNPGNLELLDASVHWLAHQDELIAQSAAATAAPMVRAIDERSLRLVRFATIGGLPVFVLLCGVALRVLRK
jgi:hypothetical protein